MISYHELWAQKYAGLYAAAVAEEDQRRAEDFVDLPRTVCGLPLRALTPRDLLHLELAKNAFLCGGELRSAHVAQFLWALHAAPPATRWGERRFFRHCGKLVFAEAVTAIRAYLDRVFADQPRGGGEPGEKPIGTSFLAPLIVRVASGIPGLSPRDIMDTPLPQLFQYQRVLAAEAAVKAGRSAVTFSASDRFPADCMEEVNQINAAALAATKPAP